MCKIRSSLNVIAHATCNSSYRPRVSSGCQSFIVLTIMQLISWLTLLGAACMPYSSFLIGAISSLCCIIHFKDYTITVVARWREALGSSRIKLQISFIAQFLSFWVSIFPVYLACSSSRPLGQPRYWRIQLRLTANLMLINLLHFDTSRTGSSNTRL
jgi:multisubunit Na+/H+ antiporter MnhE subunit